MTASQCGRIVFSQTPKKHHDVQRLIPAPFHPRDQSLGLHVHNNCSVISAATLVVTSSILGGIAGGTGVAVASYIRIIPFTGNCRVFACLYGVGGLTLGAGHHSVRLTCPRCGGGERERTGCDRLGWVHVGRPDAMGEPGISSDQSRVDVVVEDDSDTTGRGLNDDKQLSGHFDILDHLLQH